MWHPLGQAVELFLKRLFHAARPRPAWNNDLQRVWLKNGVNRASPGSSLVDWPWARLVAVQRFGRVLTLTLLILGMPALAEAENSVATPLFAAIASPSVRSSSATAKEALVIRSRQVSINQTLLMPSDGTASPPRTAASGPTLSLNLFDGVAFTVEAAQVTRTERGLTWVGRLMGIEEGQAVIVVSDGVVSGNISMPGARYHIRFAGGGVHEIQEIASSAFPDDHPSSGSLQVTADNAPTISQPAAGSRTDDGSIIDVMVVYTSAARIGAKGVAAMQSLIDLAIAETNLSYQNSGIIQRLRLVHTEEVAYNEQGHSAPLSDALVCIQTTADGCLDNIHALRDAYGADLVSFWLEGDGSSCGLGYVNATASWGFSTVERDCATGYYSFGHELGHNMGALHDIYVTPLSTSYAANAHGYTNTTAASPWRTIMAYNDACAAVGKSCTRIQYWSNPSVLYGGAPMGTAATADNHSVLNATAYTVANFRLSKTSQSIAFTAPPTVAAGSVGTVGATATSGLPVTLSSTTTAICSVSGMTITGIAAGTCILTADQSGNSSYSPAAQGLLNFSIAAGVVQPSSPTITSITPGSGNTTLYFSSPANTGGSSIIRYTASCSASGQTTQTATGSSSPLVVRGLTGGIAYQCTVTATNGGGLTSVASTSWLVTPTLGKKSRMTPILMLLLD